MTTPAFSVLLPTRNRVDLLAQAIESVRSQDFEDWEIVVSDNASVEDVKGLVDSLADPRIVYLRSDRSLPVTENWNRAMDASRGRHVVMLGDDDGLVPGYFTDLLRDIDILQAPDIIYHGAYHFAVPGVMAAAPDGYVRDVTRLHCLLRDRREPAIVPREEAAAAARAALDMRALYGFNMQYFLFRREFLDRMRAHGPVFRGPYPDFYAANLALLIAGRVGAVPRPMTIIGITPKSYGFYHFNDNESAGVDFLENQDFAAQVDPALRGRLLPGSYMNTLWLVSVALVKDALAGEMPLKLGVERYRRLQILGAVLPHFLKGSDWRPATQALRPHLDWSERMMLLGLRGLAGVLGSLKQATRAKIGHRLFLLCDQYGQVFPEAPQIPMRAAEMRDVVAGLATLRQGHRT